MSTPFVPFVDGSVPKAADFNQLAKSAFDNAAQTALDKLATAADRFQTGEDRTAARDSATNALTSENAASDKAAEASGHANAASGQADLASNAAATTQTLRDSIIATQGSIGYLPPEAYTAGLAITLPAQTVSYSGQAYAPLLSALPFTTSGTFEMAKFRLIQGVAAVDLAAAGGAGLVGTKLTMLAAATRTVAQKLSDFVSIEDWLPAGDGVADDTAQVRAAITAAIAMGNCAIYGGFGKTYRITSKISLSGTKISIDGCNCRFKNDVTGSPADPLFEVSGASTTFISFKNFTVYATASNVGHAFAVIGTGQAPQSLNFENVYCYGIKGTGKDHTGALMPAYALYVYGIYTLSLDRFWAQQGDGGVYLDTCQKFTVQRSQFDVLTQYGVAVLGCKYVDVSGGNVFTGTGGAGQGGFYYDGCEAVIFTKNRVKGGTSNAILAGDTPSMRVTIHDNDLEVYTPVGIKITTASDSLSVCRNLVKFIGSYGPFSDGILIVDRLGGGSLSYSAEIVGNKILVGGADTLTNGIRLESTINAIRAARIEGNTIGGGGVASVVTNAINLAGNGLSNKVHNNTLGGSGGSVTNGVVVGAGHISAWVDGNMSAGTVTNTLVNSGVRTRVYESGAFNLTITGCTTSPLVNCVYERTGTTVTLKMLTANAVSNSTNCTLTGLPASIQPPSNQWQPVQLFDNGAESMGAAQIGASGTITLSKGAVSGPFSLTGTKGLRACSITYTL